MFNKTKSSHLIRGEQSEQLAQQYLIKQGLQAVEKNYHCKHGELDLIMRDQETIVIIEVRYRKSSKFGGAEESITPTKQSRIIATTQHYLLVNKIKRAIRFDVIAMSGNNEINWIQNAF